MVAKYVNETMAEYVNTSGKYVSVISILHQGNDITYKHRNVMQSIFYFISFHIF